jgi:hypothetical protein
MDASHTAFWTAIATVVPVIALVATLELRRRTAWSLVQTRRSAYLLNSGLATFYAIGLIVTEVLALLVLSGTVDDAKVWRGVAVSLAGSVFFFILTSELFYVWARVPPDEPAP